MKKVVFFKTWNNTTILLYSFELSVFISCRQELFSLSFHMGKTTLKENHLEGKQNILAKRKYGSNRSIPSLLIINCKQRHVHDIILAIFAKGLRHFLFCKCPLVCFKFWQTVRAERVLLEFLEWSCASRQTMLRSEWRPVRACLRQKWHCGPKAVKNYCSSLLGQRSVCPWGLDHWPCSTNCQTQLLGFF